MVSTMQEIYVSTVRKVPEDQVSKNSSSDKIGQLLLTLESGDVSGEGTEERILELNYTDFRVP